MKKVSDTYTLSYLAKHPQTKDLVFRHLSKTSLDKKQILGTNGTLREMFDTNMGGGIPYDLIVCLMNELDSIEMPLTN